ncbi:hypothetical protein KIN20_020287 [Parelaphostrongylus tenuis]|uniref:Uncharacterized protein n=1 Tax=Parelaphostrongylus tenuis TaxID=148309 RepID=A0AAD5N9N1_PARTN|nr:hypothetical protein KIN20_020287 [Parelaphostrongylus tenuis]
MLGSRDAEEVGPRYRRGYATEWQLKDSCSRRSTMVSSRTFKEWGVFAGLIVVMHFAYYTIQNNPSLVAPDKRAELFYVRWLKEKFPALRPYGVQEEKRHPPSASE